MLQLSTLPEAENQVCQISCKLTQKLQGESTNQSTTLLLHSPPVGQLHLFDVKINLILSDTSSFLWVQTSRMMIHDTFLKKII
jgi:hypothetical protein